MLLWCRVRQTMSWPVPLFSWILIWTEVRDASLNVEEILCPLHHIDLTGRRQRGPKRSSQMWDFQENVPQAPMRCKHSPQSHWESLHPIPTLTPTLCLVVGHSILGPHQDFLSLELRGGVEWEGGRQWMEGNLSWPLPIIKRKSN